MLCRVIAVAATSTLPAAAECRREETRRAQSGWTLDDIRGGNTAMDELRFDRHFRTPSSEGYHIMRGTTRLGTVDLHFTSTTVHCTLIIEQEMPRVELTRLIEEIDEDLVLSA